MDNETKPDSMLKFIAPNSRRSFFEMMAKVAGVGGVAAAGLIAQTGSGSGTGSTGSGTGSTGSGSGSTGSGSGSTGTGSGSGTGSTGTGTGSSGGTLTAATVNDLAVLNYALTLEFLEATYYTYFLGQGPLPSGVTTASGLVGTVSGQSPSSTGQFTASNVGSSKLLSTIGSTTLNNGVYGLLGQVRDHEQAHVATLLTVIKSLGGTPVQPCDYTFPVNSFDDFLTVGDSLENVGVSAYDGAVAMIQTPALITAGATIATVEARHASFFNLLTGMSPFPMAFDMTRTMAQVLAIAGQFIKSCPTPPMQTVAMVSPNMMTTSQSSIMLDASASTSGNGNLNYFYQVLPGGLVPSVEQAPYSPNAKIDFVNGPGTYLLQLVVTDANGIQSTQNITLTYKP